jgi:hypothetical protein
MSPGQTAAASGAQLHHSITLQAAEHEQERNEWAHAQKSFLRRLRREMQGVGGVAQLQDCIWHQYPSMGAIENIEKVNV